MSYLRYLCLFAESGVQHNVVFLLCFSSSCVPYATYDASNVGFVNVNKWMLVVKRQVGILCSHAISRTHLVWDLAHWNSNPRVYMLFDTDALLDDEFEDIKGPIRIRISKKNIQHNGQQKKVQKANQWYTKHTQKTKDRVTRTPFVNRGWTHVLRKGKQKVNMWM